MTATAETKETEYDEERMDLEYEVDIGTTWSTAKTSFRRKFSFKYFLYSKGEEIQVCKPFYLGTLSISQKPIYDVHLTKIKKPKHLPQIKKGKM